MDKPFKTIAEQMSLLESRGVATDAGTASDLETTGVLRAHPLGPKQPLEPDRIPYALAPDRRAWVSASRAAILARVPDAGAGPDALRPPNETL